MRKISIVISIVLMEFAFSCSTAPAGFTITAHVDGVSNGTVFYVMNWRDNAILDSSYVENGSFFLDGRLSGPEHLLLHGRDSLTNDFLYTNLLIGNESVTINAHKEDFPWNIDVSGSETQEVAERFNQVEYQKQKLSKLLRADFDKHKADDNDEQRLNNKLASISDSLDKVKIGLIKEYFNSYAALINFKYYKNHFSTVELTDLYNKLSDELKKTTYGGSIKTQIDYPAKSVGDSYYDYEAVNPTGDTIALSAITNKFILLHFSSAACYYSQESLRELRTIYSRYKDKLEIVKISEDISKDAWLNSVSRDSITWTNLWDGKGEYGDAVIKYGTTGTPNYILISPDKKILEKWFGYENGVIEEKLGKHL